MARLSAYFLKGELATGEANETGRRRGRRGDGDGDVVSRDRRNDDEDDKEEEEKERHFLPFGSPEKSSRTSFCICLCATAPCGGRF